MSNIIRKFKCSLVACLFLVFVLGGCATYKDTVVINADKTSVFLKLSSYAKRDYRQIYYDPQKQIEIFAPTISQWELTFGRSTKPNDILIFEEVTRPTGCPLTSKSWPPINNGYKPSDAFCYFGNGRLAGYFNADSMRENTDEADYEALALRAIYQKYVENEEQTILKQMAICNCTKEQAEEQFVRYRIRENWPGVRENRKAQWYFQKNKGISANEFGQSIINDETFLGRAIHTARQNENISRVAVRYQKPVKTINNKSSNDFDLFELFVEAAVNVWVYKEKAKISQKELDKIYAASRRGARAGARSANRQKAIW